MKFSLDVEATAKALAKLQEANLAFSERCPGENAARQPIHTVYGGAHLFKSDSAAKLAAIALRSLDEYAPNFVVFAKALQLPGYQELPSAESAIKDLGASLQSGRSENKTAQLAYVIYARVIDKIKGEAIEDFRIDYEDGYGSRTDSEEDLHAETAAKEVALGMARKTLPPFIGIRIKPLSEELKMRSARTLDLFITTLLTETKGTLPDNFVITLPKVTIPEQVIALVDLFRLLEAKNGLRPASLKMELMIETAQSIFNHRGEITLPSLIAVADGRCRGAHFGAYDYTASLSISAPDQTMDHPACDFARQVMKVALAGTEIWLADGATNIMPVGPHKAKAGSDLTANQSRQNREAVHHGWKLSFDHICASLRNGFYQGWDLHPAQLPVRYAACYHFFLQALHPASLRLSSFMEKAAQATLLGNVFDDAATGQGLLNYYLRALNCGAITEEEIKAAGLTLDEVRSRSFVKILAARRQLK